MLILGLTGSIAMGKSRVARMFRAHGVPVFDADAAVHALFAPGGPAVAPVVARFGDVLDAAGGIDRRRLGALVLGDAPSLAALERIVHPLVRAEQRRFLGAQCRARRDLVVLDIPLLLESGGEERVDHVAVVSAHPALQSQRALARPGMTPAKLDAILAKQMPDAQKRKRADFVIPSGHDRGLTSRYVGGLILELRGRPGRAWPARWLGADPG